MLSEGLVMNQKSSSSILLRKKTLVSLCLCCHLQVFISQIWHVFKFQMEPTQVSYTLVWYQRQAQNSAFHPGILMIIALDFIFLGDSKFLLCRKKNWTVTKQEFYCFISK